MLMTDEEILISFREAKHPSKQITILADLNCTSRPKIIRRLEELGENCEKFKRKTGCKVDDRIRKRTRTKAPT